MLEWPRELISAQTVGWKLTTPAQEAGASLAGVPQQVFLSGGPFWELSISGLIMRGETAIKAGRAFQGALGNGERPLLIRPCDCRQVPLADGESLLDSPPPVEASIVSADLRATAVTIAIAAGFDITRLVGSHFSIINPTWGERMHRIIRRRGGTDEAPEVDIRPPLREAIATETALNFNTPGCLMRLSGPFQHQQTIPKRLHTGSATFCELERPPGVDE